MAIDTREKPIPARRSMRIVQVQPSKITKSPGDQSSRLTTQDKYQTPPLTPTSLAADGRNSNDMHFIGPPMSRAIQYEVKRPSIAAFRPT